VPVRVLIAEPGPAFSVQDVFAGWREALTAAGQDVFVFNLADRLTFYGSVLLETAPGSGVFKRALDGEQATELAVNGLYASILKTRPHVLLSVSSFFLPLELFAIARAAGVKVVMVHTESPYEDDRQLKLAEHADLNLINDPTNIEAFRAIAPTQYFPQAYRPSVHHPGTPTPDLVCDLGFVGTGFPSRVEFFEALDLDGLDVILAGNWQLLDDTSPLRRYVAHDLDDCLDNADTADIYRSARVGINLYRREAQAARLSAGWSMGPRELEMAACGLFFLRDPRGEGDELLDMLPTFTGPGEASEQLRYWLARDDERQALADKARAAVDGRTFDNSAARLLRLLDQQGR
jgi:spore maturation protein CgeB